MAALDQANDPEEDSDVEEQEGIGKQEGVVIAPWPDVSISVKYCRVIVVVEGEIEEYGGKRNKECYCSVLQIPTHMVDA